jgi:hypothetical protein
LRELRLGHDEVADARLVAATVIVDYKHATRIRLGDDLDKDVHASRVSNRHDAARYAHAGFGRNELLWSKSRTNAPLQACVCEVCSGQPLKTLFGVQMPLLFVP